MSGFPVGGTFRKLTDVELLVLGVPENTNAWLFISNIGGELEESSSSSSESERSTSSSSASESGESVVVLPQVPTVNLDQSTESVVVVAETPPATSSSRQQPTIGPHRRGRVRIQLRPLRTPLRERLERSRSPLRRFSPQLSPPTPSYSTPSTPAASPTSTTPSFSITPPALSFSPLGDFGSTSTPKTAGRLIPKKLQFS